MTSTIHPAPSAAPTPIERGRAVFGSVGAAKGVSRRSESFGVVFAAHAHPLDIMPTSSPGETGARAERLETLRDRDVAARSAGDSRIAGATRQAAEKSAPDIEAHRSANDDAEISRLDTDQPVGPSGGLDARQRPAGSERNDQHQSARNLAPAVRENLRSASDAVSQSRPVAADHTSQGDEHDVAPAAERNATKPADVSGALTIPKPISTTPASKIDLAKPEYVNSSGRPVESASRGTGSSTDGLAAKSGDKPESAILKRASASSNSSLANPSEVRAESLIQRIARVIQSRFDGNEIVARLRLDPPSLGELQVHLSSRGEALTLKMSAETAETRELLSANMGLLRSAMAEHGLRIANVELSELAHAAPADRLQSELPTQPPAEPQANHGPIDAGTSDTSNTHPHHLSDDTSSRQRRSADDEAAKSALRSPSIAPGEGDVRVDELLRDGRIDIRV